MKRIIYSLAALLLGAQSALAAVSPNSFVTTQTPNRGYVGLTSSSSLNAYSTLYTAGANGSRCYSISATSTDSVAHNVAVQVQNSGNIVYHLSVAVGIAAGSPPISGGGPAVPILTSTVSTGLPVDQYGNQYLQLASGDSLTAALTYTAISASQVVDIYAVCSDY